MDDTETMRVWGLAYPGWVAVFLAAMAAAAAAFGLGLGPWWLMLAPLVLAPGVAHAQMKWLGRKGISSPALTRYGRDFLIAAGAYVVCLYAAVQGHGSVEPSRAATLGLAALPLLPTLAMIWIVVRYLVEETDQYLRERAIVSALFGLFAVLAFGSLWGFLELFGMVPGLWTGWVFPAWWIGLAIGHGWQWMRGR